MRQRVTTHETKQKNQTILEGLHYKRYLQPLFRL